MYLKTDFLIIGSGIAGLIYALDVSEHGKVVLITKKRAIDTNTNLAQGGIASVFGNDDTFESHIRDTKKSGAGICKNEVVRSVITSGPAQIKKLEKMGVCFSRDIKTSKLNLGREGGHSKNRIVHAKDTTGKEIERVLLSKVIINKNITLLEEHIAIDLIVSPNKKSRSRNKKECFGAYVYDNKTCKVETFISQITLLASGGAGKVYLYSSNPDIATGDGIAMGYRAGAIIANLEFVQFHPTCLYNHQSTKIFLISEAVRGEGGVLLDPHGTPFMQKYDPILKDLACRDIAARAINSEIKKNNHNSVFLDISHRKTEFIKTRFPNLYKKCYGFGIDITKEPIPVVPAAHYMCGGIATDMNAKTNISRLYAVGETACTGLHGANRLASNSLLEALVYATFAAKRSILEIKKLEAISNVDIKNWPNFESKLNGNMTLISHNWNKIQRLMWNYVGIIRSNKGLDKARRDISDIKTGIKEYYWNFKVSSQLIELRNIADVSELIIRSASLRKESRGLHYNISYPKQNDLEWKRNSFIQKNMK